MADPHTYVHITTNLDKVTVPYKCSHIDRYTRSLYLLVSNIICFRVYFCKDFNVIHPVVWGRAVA